MLRGKVLITASGVLTAAILLIGGPAGGQDMKGQVQVKIGSHDVKMEAKKLYEISVDGQKDQRLTITIPGPTPAITVNTKDYRVEKLYFIPADDGNQKVNVIPPVGFGNVTVDYVLKVKNVALGDKPVLEEKGNWTEKDQTYKPEKDSYYKDFKIKGKAGRVIVIDLVGKVGETDPYLYLEGPPDHEGKIIVARDDDSGGNLNARIVYTPTQDFEFRVIATTLSKKTGEFTLTVREGK